MVKKEIGIDENIKWLARKEKDALLKRYALDELKKLAFILTGGDIEHVRIKDSTDVIIRFMSYEVCEGCEVTAYIKVIEKLAVKNSIRYPIC